MLISKLSPVVHKTLTGLHRVPMRIVGDQYEVFVADSYVRIYDKDSLPDEIKVKLAMIHTIPIATLLRDSDLFNSNYLIYENLHDPTLDDIGWRVTQNMYCLVLKTDYLRTLRGYSNE